MKNRGPILVFEALRFVSRSRISCCVPEVTSGEMRKEILVFRSTWKVALSNALGLKNTELASGRPGKAPEASDSRDFVTGFRQRVQCSWSAKRDPRWAGRTRPVVVGMGRKPASRKALAELYQVTVNRRIQVQARPAARGLAAPRGRRKSVAMLRRLPEEPQDRAASMPPPATYRRGRRSPGRGRRRSPERARPRARARPAGARGSRCPGRRTAPPARGERPSVHYTPTSSDRRGHGDATPPRDPAECLSDAAARQGGRGTDKNGGRALAPS